MTSQELFEMIAEQLDYNKKEIVQAANELISVLENDKARERFIYDLKYERDNFALDENPICPMCTAELSVIDTWEENRGEYQGFQCSETINKIGCSICDYILNE